ncbi:CD209 antigen-like protein D [Habropoda laboriosa]|uniref:CD209 antigen-like protein D n=1 Tax=Habropoda laboriosa TaxID=597456 RepID=A0A0L7QWN5_9HYME|nr:CD209 antigen-like protein D [Habropoda laboriosa]
MRLKLNLIMCDSCCQIDSRELPYYKLMKSNARSDQLILSTATVQNISECRKFAWAKKALAFNYEWNIGTQNRRRGTRKICQVLQCPEIHNFTTLVHDKNYKYYSTYPSSISIDSSFTLACIPRAGVFVFSSNNLNYSQAQTACQKFNASLAHIISEERTNGLAKYISLNTPTFVGLSNRNNEKLWKNEFGEPLFCFNYRAWGKGQPSHSKGCVSLVQLPEVKPGSFWKVVSCDSILPFICEILPIYQFLRN